MALSPGTRLGHYDVTALIGEGGMGQVWQATDTQLNRQVALKILPDAFADDPDRLARFQREAQVLASLNHPGIAAIYGIEKSDDTQALVLELVEGPTLADRIAKGPIPIDEALPIAEQIAEALEAAHEAGVIHRDLKPANIKVRDDGTVKVLDFGLAKALDPAPDADPSQSPTLTAAATQMGVIMGTAAYMSPEQAAGKSVDKRGDIWSFGVVLFEMLTGERVFTGETVSHVLAKVLDREPDFGAVLHMPMSLRQMLRRCLTKDRKDRLHDIGDARLELNDVLATGYVEEAAPQHLRLWQRPVPAGLSAVMLVLVTFLAARVFMVNEPPVSSVGSDPTHLQLATPANVTLTHHSWYHTLAISGDGRQLAYVGEGPHLFLQNLNTGTITQLPGTEGAGAPFFSPDGRWVGFVADYALQKVAVDGGQPVELARVSDFRGGAWSPDGEFIYFASAVFGGISRVPADGGEVELVTTPARDGYDQAHWWPEVLPGSDRLLFTSCCSRKQVMAFDLETGQQTPLLADGFFARYAPSGHIIFGQGDSLLAATFDLDSLEVGTPSLVVEQVVTGHEWHAEYAISDSGTLAYFSGASAFDRTLVRVDLDGTMHSLSPEERFHSHPVSFSPDDARVAVTQYHGPTVQQDIFLFDLIQGDYDVVTTDPHNDFHPKFSPDGRQIVFSSTRSGQVDLYVVPADKSAPPALLFANDYAKWTTGWHPEGTLLAFGQEHPETGWDVWTYALGESEAHPLLTESLNEGDAVFSPDGRWLAYHSDEAGQYEVYVVPYPGPGSRCKVSAAGGEHPHWSLDGTRLFFSQGSSGDRVTAMVADVSSRDFCRTEPRALFDGLDSWRWNVSPTGDFFVTLEPRDPPRLNLVLDWVQELTERVPVD